MPGQYFLSIPIVDITDVLLDQFTPFMEGLNVILKCFGHIRRRVIIPDCHNKPLYQIVIVELDA